jgi:hypothetical protein
LQKVQKDRSIEDISPTESVVENSPLAPEEASSTDEGLVNQTVRFNLKKKKRSFILSILGLLLLIRLTFKLKLSIYVTFTCIKRSHGCSI